MLNIVLICGGTGSIALQNGLNSLYGIENYNLDVVINAYDNGKSTGVCRKVFGNKILGPSDLRKNQLTSFEIMYKDLLKDENSYERKLYNLFELRYSADDYKAYYSEACKYISQSDWLSDDIKAQFQGWIDFFFFENEKKWRQTVIDVEYNDFSLSNIFYAACAAENNNSLEKAGTEIAKILNIKDNIHLVSDKSLFLKAETQSGKIIEDEGDIVCWDNPDDKIERTFLYDCENDVEYTPKVDEMSGKSIKEVFSKADIIIFSSGTQWSSLIPTYIHIGFDEMIRESKAKKYLIMNNAEDHDMYGVSADELLDIIKRYIDLSDVTIVINDNAAPTMKNVNSSYKCLHGKLSAGIGEKKHIPEAVAGIILKDFFSIDDNLFLISDLDGTLWDEMGNDISKKAGAENLNLFEGIILSGNSYNHVAEVTEKYFKNRQSNWIYCDYGNTFFHSDDIQNKQILSEEFLIDDDLISELNSFDDLKGKMCIRGGVILTIKPLNNRSEKIEAIKDYLVKYGSKYKVKIAGRTSIDIMRSEYNKESALRLILNKMQLSSENVLYIGNELDVGNDKCVKNVNVKTLQVNDVFEMNMFLKTLKYIFEK